MSTMPAPRLFLSFNHADRAWAMWIDWQLKRGGFEVVQQSFDFKPRSKFVAQAHEEAATAALTVAVFSPDYVRGELSNPEWVDLFRQDCDGREARRTLAVVVRQCELPGRLSALPTVSVLDLDEPAAVEAIVRGIMESGSGAGKWLAERPGQPLDSIDWSVVPDADRPVYPGHKSIVRVPQQRNAHFTGREAALKSLRELLKAGHAVALTQAAGAMGSVGKTQLAVEYAWRYRDRYGLVAFLRSEHGETLAADYAALAGALHVGEAIDSRQTKVDEVRRWLLRNPRWLLVFDNAESPGDLEPYLPDTLHGHVVITSRHDDWSGVARAIEVGLFERGESVAFLEARTGLDDEAGAGELAALLLDAPLALAQAAGHITADDLSYARYVELFHGKQRQIGLPAGEPMDLELTVAATLDLAIDGVQRAMPEAAELLTLCAFLDPDGIPTWLLTDAGAQLGRELRRMLADPITFGRAQRVLGRFATMTPGDELLTVHRLVQRAARARLAEEESAKWAGLAVMMCDAALPDVADTTDLLRRRELVMPHARRAMEHAREHGADGAALAALEAKMTDAPAAPLRGTGADVAGECWDVL